MNRSVAILYGLGEGPSIGKPLLQALEQAGFQVISNAAKADYIIAHSGGLLYIPSNYQAKIFLLVGVSNRIEESRVMLAWKKFQLDLSHALREKRHWHWLQKSALNMFYIIGQMHRTKFMWNRSNHKKDFFPSISNAKVIIVNYKNDPWSKNITNKDLDVFQSYQLITHMGVHDDIWMHPEYYVKLLQANIH